MTLDRDLFTIQPVGQRPGSIYHFEIFWAQKIGEFLASWSLLQSGRDWPRLPGDSFPKWFKFDQIESTKKDFIWPLRSSHLFIHVLIFLAIPRSWVSIRHQWTFLAREFGIKPLGGQVGRFPKLKIYINLPLWLRFMDSQKFHVFGPGSLGISLANLIEAHPWYFQWMWKKAAKHLSFTGKPKVVFEADLWLWWLRLTSPPIIVHISGRQYQVHRTWACHSPVLPAAQLWESWSKDDNGEDEEEYEEE